MLVAALTPHAPLETKPPCSARDAAPDPKEPSPVPDRPPPAAEQLALFEALASRRHPLTAPAAAGMCAERCGAKAVRRLPGCKKTGCPPVLCASCHDELGVWNSLSAADARQLPWLRCAQCGVE